MMGQLAPMYVNPHKGVCDVPDHEDVDLGLRGGEEGGHDACRRANVDARVAASSVCLFAVQFAWLGSKSIVIMKAKDATNRIVWAWTWGTYV